MTRIVIFILLLLLASSALLFLPARAATTYKLTLQTDAPSYYGSQRINITGFIFPAPGPNTGVIVMIKNPVGSLADIIEAFPDPVKGNFSGYSVAGGSPAWIAGTFVVNATWGGPGGNASNQITFNYSPTSTSSTSSTSTTTTSTTSTTTTSSSTTTSAVPEFPSEILALLSIVSFALVGVLSRAFGSRDRTEHSLN